MGKTKLRVMPRAFSALLAILLVAGLMPPAWSSQAFADEGADAAAATQEDAAADAALEHAGAAAAAGEENEPVADAAENELAVAAAEDESEEPAAAEKGLDVMAEPTAADAEPEAAAEPAAATDADATEPAAVAEPEADSEPAAATEPEIDAEPAAATDSDEPQKEAALDPAKLEDGTYSVDVTLVQASDTSQNSMAGGAINGTAQLVVKDGAYTLLIPLGTIAVGDITGYVKQIDEFASFTVDGTKVTTSGTAAPVWTGASEGDAGPATVPVPDTAKSDGIIAVSMHSDQMPVSPQKAAIRIDWSTLQKVSDEAPDVLINPTDPDTPGSDSDNPGESDDPEPQPAEPTEPENPVQEPAPSEPEVVKFAGIFQPGHVYSVPISFYKSDSWEGSMASQYFGSYAVVRVLNDGTLDVRFSTSRPDYIESVSPAWTTAEGPSYREFCVYVPATNGNYTVFLNMVATPMKELGIASVAARMVISLGAAVDQGGDSGQMASGVAGIAATGDAGGFNFAALTVLASGAAATALLARRRFGMTKED